MIEILRLSAPLTIWVTMFSAVYALQGFTCSRHWPEDLWARPILLGAWAVGVILQVCVVMAIHHAPSKSVFVQRVAIGISVVALVAVIWTLLPVVTTSTCL